MNWKVKKFKPHNWYETPHKWFAWYPIRIYTTTDIEEDEIIWWDYVVRTGEYMFDSQGGAITWSYDFCRNENEEEEV